MGLLRISQTIFSTFGEICKLAIKVAVRNYRNGIVGEIGDFKSNSDPTARIAPHPAIGTARSLFSIFKKYSSGKYTFKKYTFGRYNFQNIFVKTTH